MTQTQVFKWFCKEQKIMGLIQKMYHKIHPYRLSCINKYEYINFDKYIENKINFNGFYYLLWNIFDDYFNKIRATISFEEFYERRNKFIENNAKLIKKWEYFANHNIILNDDILGKKFKYNNWGEIYEMTITSLNIPNGRVCATVKINGREYPTTISLGNLISWNDKKVKINFSIKRNRKVYHGKN